MGKGKYCGKTHQKDGFQQMGRPVLTLAKTTTSGEYVEVCKNQADQQHNIYRLVFEVWE